MIGCGCSVDVDVLGELGGVGASMCWVQITAIDGGVHNFGEDHHSTVQWFLIRFICYKGESKEINLRRPPTRVSDVYI